MLGGSNDSNVSLCILETKVRIVVNTVNRLVNVKSLFFFWEQWILFLFLSSLWFGVINFSRLKHYNEFGQTQFGCHKYDYIILGQNVNISCVDCWSAVTIFPSSKTGSSNYLLLKHTTSCIVSYLCSILLTDQLWNFF